MTLSPAEHARTLCAGTGGAGLRATEAGTDEERA